MGATGCERVRLAECGTYVRGASNGHDAAAFIVSANLERRNLTKGQQAMALAMIYPEKERGGRGRQRKGGRKLPGLVRHQSDIKQARTVLHHSSALAEDVMARRTSLDKALETVEQERLCWPIHR